MRSRRVFRLTWNLPARVLPQMKVRPRKLKVSGLPRPRRSRRSLVLEPDDEIVGIAHDDHIAGGLAPSPAHGPASNIQLTFLLSIPTQSASSASCVLRPGRNPYE